MKAWLNIFVTIIFFHVIRFSGILTHPSMLLNDLLLGLLLLAPISLIVFSPTSKNKWWNLAAIGLSCLSGLRLILLIIGMITEDYSKSYDPSFQPIRIYSQESTNLVVYKTNCGATCAFGIVVRHEKPLALGFTLTRVILRENRCDNAQVEDNEGVLEISACSSFTALRPEKWIYF